VQLVGVPHPSPKKAQQFRDISRLIEPRCDTSETV